MPKTHLDKQTLKTLYRDFSRETDRLEALMRRPQYVIVLRLSAGLSQTAFENLLCMSKNLYKYESGKIRPTKRTAERFLSKHKGLAPWETVWETFQTLSAESQGWFSAHGADAKATAARRLGAVNQMKKRELTGQESEVARWLDAKGIPYQANAKVGHVFVDFYIPGLKLALECKRLTTRNRREQMKKVKEAAFQGYKTRFYEKNVKLAVLFESQLGLGQVEKEELMGPYQFVLEKIEQLESITKDEDA